MHSKISEVIHGSVLCLTLISLSGATVSKIIRYKVCANLQNQIFSKIKLKKIKIYQDNPNTVLNIDGENCHDGKKNQITLIICLLLLPQN
jgi:hypothetical protein